jgi:predicted urease superfamily metal-dependent hydrolase
VIYVRKEDFDRIQERGEGSLYACTGPKPFDGWTLVQLAPEPDKALNQLRSKLDRLASLIDELAITPAPEFYAPGDHMAGRVNDAWIEKNRIMQEDLE